MTQLPYAEPVDDPYAVLGVARSASTEDIRRAYVALARRTHPDIRHDDPDAAERMRRINEAWEILSDNNARAATDRYLRRQSNRSNSGTTPTEATPNPGSPPPSDAEHGSRHRHSYSFESDPSYRTFHGDDSAITGGELPTWMRLGAPAIFVLGIFAIVFGVLVGGFVLVRLGLMSIVGSAALFFLSPFVVLVRSRRGPYR